MGDYGTVQYSTQRRCYILCCCTVYSCYSIYLIRSPTPPISNHHACIIIGGSIDRSIDGGSSKTARLIAAREERHAARGAHHRIGHQYRDDRAFKRGIDRAMDCLRVLLYFCLLLVMTAYR